VIFQNINTNRTNMSGYKSQLPVDTTQAVETKKNIINDER
jgi:hypothetical protein